jgi:hypothetical protein
METIFTVFTPAEAERITGVSVTLQRDWRRREIMPKREGHARFDLRDLADMFALKCLFDAGIWLEQAKQDQDLLPFITAGVMMHALAAAGSIEGDLREHRRQFGRLSLLRIVTHDLRLRTLPGGDLIIWPNGEFQFAKNVERTIRGAEPEKKYGTIRILNLQALGQEFARRAGRALVRIEMQTAD